MLPCRVLLTWYWVAGHFLLRCLEPAWGSWLRAPPGGSSGAPCPLFPPVVWQWPWPCPSVPHVMRSRGGGQDCEEADQDEHRQSDAGSRLLRASGDDAMMGVLGLLKDCSPLRKCFSGEADLCQEGLGLGYYRSLTWCRAPPGGYHLVAPQRSLDHCLPCSPIFASLLVSGSAKPVAPHSLAASPFLELSILCGIPRNFSTQSSSEQ